MVNHGVNATEKSTSVTTPVVAESGIPFVVGTAPVHTAENPAPYLKPVLVSSWDEAVEMFGYSDDWDTYTLCEVMYSHFKLYGRSPVIFCNAWDNLSKTKESSVELSFTDHKAVLPIDAVNDFNSIQGNSGTELVRGTDFEAYYEGDNLVIELLSTSGQYDETECLASYKSVVIEVTETEICEAFDAVNYCITRLGITPDLLLAPKWSGNSTVAAVMTTLASNISGLFKAKSLHDIEGAAKYSEVLEIKNFSNLTDSEQIICWPKVKLGDKKFHLSTQLAGLMAQVDTDNGGVPCESPSNKNLKCDSLCDDDGNEIDLGLTEANYLNDNGIVTAISFINGFVAWGNYTACYPSNTDVKDYFIPISRSFKWVGNTLVRTFWSKVDNPMNRRLIDTVIDSANIWLNGLVGQGYFLGARAEFLESENPTTDLMAGKIRIHVYITPPSPAQRIDFITEYDTNYVSTLFEA